MEFLNLLPGKRNTQLNYFSTISHSIKMKKNSIYLVLFLLLSGITGYLIYNNSKSTIRKELSDFAVSDTASINKIFMADKQGKQILLERKGTGWIVNGKFEARQDLINMLLYTMKSMQVLSPVGKNLYNNTMKLLASSAVKVEIYSNQELIKTYYVGHPTMDNLGTFMYLEGSSVPFIMFIPGFNGYLTTRFDIMEQDWRSKNIFSLNPRMITEAKVIDPNSADSSFTLSLKDSTYSIQTNNGKTLSRLDFGKLHNFLIGFGNTNYEMIFEKIPSTFKDSLLNAGPFKIIEVRSFTGELKQVSLYRKSFTGVSMNPNDDDDVTYPYDPDRFYLSVAGDKEWYICQYLNWSKLLKTPSYFIPSSKPSK